jgi:hypothetical protein
MRGLMLSAARVVLSISLFASLGAASASAQEAGSSLQLVGVPATLAIPDSFTITVNGSTGATSHALIYPVYGPAPCAGSVEAQFEASPYEYLVNLQADEVPVFGFAGTFTLRAEGIGQALTAPGLYTVCVFMEATAEAEPVEPLEEERLVAVASATFTVLPAPSGTSRTTLDTGLRRCVVPRVKGRRPGFAEKAITRAHCSVGNVRKAGLRRGRRGRVLRQSRRAGKSLPAGAKVSLVVGS